MIALLIFVPVLLLVISAFGIILLQQFRPSIGYSWLWASSTALVSLALVFYLRWRLPLEFLVDRWRPFAEYTSSPVFLLDSVSWPYAISLVVLLLAMLWTDSARLQVDARPRNWAISLLATALGLLAVLSGSPLTLVLSWTAIDLFELIVVLGTRAGSRMSESTIISFSVRVTGTLLVIAAILFSAAQGFTFTFATIPVEAAVFMLVAAGLRLGVLPLNLPYSQEVYAWRGLGNLIRMVGPASSLMVLGRMPIAAVPQEWQPLFLALSCLAVLYGSAMWLTAHPGSVNRPYWVITLSGFAVISVVRGDPPASVAWGVVLLLVGSTVFLFTAERRQMRFIPWLGLLGIVGLPFTPAALGWRGIMTSSFSVYNPVLMLSVLFLLWGYVRHILYRRDMLGPMENWVHTVFPIGLMLLLLSQWVISYLGLPGGFSVGVWWASAAVALLALLIGALVYSFRQRLSADTPQMRWIVVAARRIGGILAVVFRLNWLYQLLAWAYRLLQSIIQLLTAIFEGDGGVLWVLLMLALLVSIITTGGSP